MASRRILFLTLMVIAAFGAAPPDVTPDAARADAARGDYRAALQKIATLLAPPNQPLPGDLYDLLMLKGECQLQLKDRLGSVSTFKSAAKAADGVKQLADASANAVIIERSFGGTYTPSFATGESAIDVLSPESRKKAMARLQQELWAKNKPELDRAMQADTLPPIERVFTAIADAYCLELATTGDAKQTGPAMRELGDRAFRLMDAEAVRAAREIDQLSQLANSAQGYGNTGWGVSQRGLMPAERNQLRDTGGYLAKMQTRAASTATPPPASAATSRNGTPSLPASPTRWPRPRPWPTSSEEPFAVARSRHVNRPAQARRDAWAGR